ncbi:MAG: hypothetical protein ACYC2O_09370, partial [Microthrixaceae bacterium]
MNGGRRRAELLERGSETVAIVGWARYELTDPPGRRWERGANMNRFRWTILCGVSALGLVAAACVPPTTPT